VTGTGNEMGVQRGNTSIMYVDLKKACDLGEKYCVIFSLKLVYYIHKTT